MRMLVIAPPLTGQGGIETCVRNLVKAAKLRGDVVSVAAVCPSSDSSQWTEGLDYEVMNAKFNRSPLDLALTAWRLSGVIRRLKPDVVIGLHASHALILRIACLLAFSRALQVVWLHFSFALRQKIGLLRLADLIVCISSDLAEAVVRDAKIRPEKVCLSFNGTEMPASLIGRPQAGALKILHVGRLQLGKQKCTDQMLQALSRVDGDWRLQVIGAGPDVPALQALALTHGLSDRINWEGWQPDVWGFIKDAHVLVLCSAFEGFPMILIEAMARGVACISSDCRSGPSDIIEDGVTGWLYPEGDIQALAARIQVLIESPDSLPDQDRLRSRVAERFSIEVVYERMRSAFERSLRDRGQRA